jgi:uncharacterized protein (TIGR02147 family)
MSQLETKNVSSDRSPQAPDFRRFLQNELLERCRKNPRYSIRAFAIALQIDHSTLSQFVRGKRRLSDAIQFRLASRLGLGPVELARYFSEAASHADQPVDATPAIEPQELTLDAFQVIADWYHYAIFELVTLKDFRPEPRWMAKILGISVSEVHVAIERLFRLGLLQKDPETGYWTQGSPLITTTGNPFTAAAFRKLQAQVLHMALVALEEVPIEERDQTSMTMAIPVSKIPEAKERIKKFRREFCAGLQDNDANRDSVYQLGISFYPLTRSKKGKNR